MSTLTFEVHWTALGTRYVKSRLSNAETMELIKFLLDGGYSFEVISKRKEK